MERSEQDRLLFDSDNPKYGYGLRNNHGFYMRTLVTMKFLNLINQAGISLKDKKILDLGCGDGWFLRFLAEMQQSPKNKLVGYDLDEKQICGGLAINPNIDLLCQDISKDFPENSGTFDLIVANVSLMFLKDKVKYQHCLDEIKRVLKPKGHFILYESVSPGSETLRSFSEESFNRIADYFQLNIFVNFDS